MYQHVPLDHLLSDMNAFDASGADMDLWISVLIFRNLDSMRRPQAFVIDVRTERADVWGRLVADCTRKVWIRQELRGVALYMPSPDYECVRLYTYSGAQGWRAQRACEDGWDVVDTMEQLRRELDTPTMRSRYAQWISAQEEALADATTFVEGRHAHTAVEQSIVIAGSRGGCAACGAPAIRHASSTIGDGAKARMLHLPLCEAHFIEAQQHPSILDFASHLFHQDLDLPPMKRLDHVPDEMIESLRHEVAAQLGAISMPPIKRRNGWHLRFALRSGWSYLLRIRTLLDYAYMLYDAQDAQRYRADSAPHHPEVPFFPDHEHAAPDGENGVTPSFLYGNPVWDAKRLAQVARSLGAYPDNEAP